MLNDIRDLKPELKRAPGRLTSKEPDMIKNGPNAASTNKQSASHFSYEFSECFCSQELKLDCLSTTLRHG